MKISCNEIVKENKSSCTIATFVDTKTTVTRRKDQSYKTNATLNETTIAKLITNWKINNRNNNNKYNKNKKKNTTTTTSKYHAYYYNIVSKYNT